MICFTSLHTVMGVAVTNPLSTKPPDTDTEVVNFFLADYVNLLKMMMNVVMGQQYFCCVVCLYLCWTM